MALSKILPASQEQYVGARNLIINGAMTVSQRNGTSAITPTGYNNFIVDRFSATNSSSNKMSFQQVTDAPDGFYNSIKATTTTAVSSLGATERYYITTVLEGNTVTNTDWGKSSGKTCTISFWVKSSLTGNFPFSLNTPTGTPCYNTTYNIPAANTWEHKTITVVAPTTGTWNLGTNSGSITLVWGLGTGSTYSTSTTNTWQNTFYEFVDGAVAVVSTLNATLQITGVQLEVGETATPFEHRTYASEEIACNRYFYEASPKWPGFINADATNNLRLQIQFPVKMRASPTVTNSGISSGFSIGTVQTNDKTHNFELGHAGSVDFRPFLGSPSFKFDAEL